MTTCIRCGKPSPVITQKVYSDRVTTRSSLRKSVSDTSAMKRPFDSTMLFHFTNFGDSSDCSGNAEKRIRRALFSPDHSTRKTDKRKSASLSTSSSNTSSSINSSPLSRTSSWTSPNSTPAPEYEEYGWCPGKNCGFKFCVKCLLEYHPGQMCRVSREITSSPSREEEICNRSRGNLMCSKQSRRTLKRLCT